MCAGISPIDYQNRWKASSRHAIKLPCTRSNTAPPLPISLSVAEDERPFELTMQGCRLASLTRGPSPTRGLREGAREFRATPHR
eukprot:14436151-Alexandrium_andersonii.AAC.1